MKRFWITGLPRSGSAWVCQVMSGMDCVCIHEGLTTNENLAKGILPRAREYFGISDTTLHLLPPGGTDPLLILDRPASEVLKSLAQVGLEVQPSDVARWADSLAALARSHRGPVMVQPFNTLFRPQTINLIRRILAPKAHFPPDSELLLPNLRITSTDF